MGRGCLFGVVGLLGLCGIACVLGYFVGLPRVRENVREPLEEAVGTQIAAQLAPISGVSPGPGTFVISEDDLNGGLQAEVDQSDLFDDVTVTFTPDEFELRFTANESDVTYSGDIGAVDGRFVVTDITADGFLTMFLPASEVEKAFENVINDYLTENGLELAEAELGEGTLTLTTVDASP
jgi:hypothetical protein